MIFLWVFQIFSTVFDNFPLFGLFWDILGHFLTKNIFLIFFFIFKNFFWFFQIFSTLFDNFTFFRLFLPILPLLPLLRGAIWPKIFLIFFLIFMIFLWFFQIFSTVFDNFWAILGYFGHKTPFTPFDPFLPNVWFSRKII